MDIDTALKQARMFEASRRDYPGLVRYTASLVVNGVADKDVKRTYCAQVLEIEVRHHDASPGTIRARATQLLGDLQAHSAQVVYDTRSDTGVAVIIELTGSLETIVLSVPEFWIQDGVL